MTLMIPSSMYSCKQNSKVTAHVFSTEDDKEITVFLVKFSSEVMSRERRLG